MNILYLTNHLNVGGITSYVLSLAKGFKQKGDNVYVASSGGELVERFIAEGIGFIPIPIKTKSEVSPRLLISLLKLLPQIKEKKIEIIHANTRVTQMLAFFIARACGRPYISTCHGFFKLRLFRKLLPLYGCQVIAISEPVKKHLIEDLKVQEKYIRVVHNGIDLERFEAQEAQSKIEAKKALGLEPGLVVGIVARLSDVKGHVYLIEAMKTVLEKIPEAQLLIVGEGKMEGQLRELSKRLGISARVVFIPSIDDTCKALAAMDLFIMPSVNEGLGLGLMEAMASGLAVIGSDVGGIKSLIQNGHNGLLVKACATAELASAMLELLEDRGKREMFGNNARRFIHQNFPQEKMLSETKKIYEECLNIKN